MSQSGVLIALPRGVEMSGELEFLIALSKGALQGPGVALLPDLHCRGQIVRQQVDADGARTIAANIRRQVIRPAGFKGSK